MKLVIEVPYWFVRVCRDNGVVSDVKILSLAEDYYRIFIMKEQHSYKDIQSFRKFIENLKKEGKLKHWQ